MIILGLLAYIFGFIGAWYQSGGLTFLAIIIGLAAVIIEIALCVVTIKTAHRLGFNMFWWVLLALFWTEISYVVVTSLDKISEDNKYEVMDKCGRVEKGVLNVNQNVKKVYNSLKQEIENLKDRKGEEEAEEE